MLFVGTGISQFVLVSGVCIRLAVNGYTHSPVFASHTPPVAPLHQTCFPKVLMNEKALQFAEGLPALAETDVRNSDGA